VRLHRGITHNLGYPRQYLAGARQAKHRGVASQRRHEAPILAVAFVLTGIGLSDPLTRSFSLMGQVAGGAGLFLTGLILSAQKLGLGANAGIQSLLSNVAHPLLAWALAWLFAISPLTAREAIVLSALPVGFFGVLFGLFP
jgi:malonate transporter and related proteins